jgi:hypothetical protein
MPFFNNLYRKHLPRQAVTPNTKHAMFTETAQAVAHAKE